MGEQPAPANLEQVLDRIGEAEREGGDRTTLAHILTSIGRRSFGPLLLVAGIITLMPIVGDIPGVPTLMAFLVLLTSGQLLLLRDHFWLPNWILKRSVERHKLDKSLQWMRRPARFMDRFIRPRLTLFTHGAGEYVIAGVSVLIALAMPPMEVIPFSANGAGLALTLFGLSLMAKDGLLALLGFIFTAVTMGVVFVNLL